MIDQYVKQLAENTPVKDHRTMVSISVPTHVLDRINNLRKRQGPGREAQYMCLNRILTFYEESHGLAVTQRSRKRARQSEPKQAGVHSGISGTQPRSHTRPRRGRSTGSGSQASSCDGRE